MRNTIQHQNIADQAVSQLIREYAAERDALQAKISRSYLDNPAIRAAWLYGSVGRGDGDDVSDIDTWIVVPDDCVDGFEHQIVDACGKAAKIIDIQLVPQNGPPGGGFVTVTFECSNGPVHFDYSWQPLSKMTVPEETHLMLVDRASEPITTFPAPAKPIIQIPTRGESVPEKVRQGLSFTWLMLHVAAKNLIRYPDSDMQLMLFPKPAFEEAVSLLDAVELVGDVDWSIPVEPLAKITRLRNLVEKASFVSTIAIEHGVPISDRFGPCEERFLNMAEGVFRSCL